MSRRTGIYLKVRRAKTENIETRPLYEDNLEEIGSVESLQYDFGTIRDATNNFLDANKLGEGGFGPVYKGRLSNGEEIAVKRLSWVSRQGDVEFKNELLLVAKLQHRNIVRLLGFCLEGDERLLVYEFVPNSSLDHFIFDPNKRKNLDWGRRYKIIEGVARGILYLHEDSRLRIIHRDLKPSNILLGENMTPTIADFGMAKLFVFDQTQANTSRIVGTYGYMAPEYAMHGDFSVKSDVFSFGVMLLEIISGQKNYNHGEHLLSLAWRNWLEGTTTNLVDPLMRIGSGSEITRCIHIGLLCVQKNVANRPTMNSVVLMLNGNSLSPPMPSEPAFFEHSDVESVSYLLSTSSLRVTESDKSKEEIESVEPLQYDFGTIRDATDNFSDVNKLGQGGFGAVYKGRLSDGEEIAVKRLSRGSLQGDVEFKNELLLVAKLQHRNIVRHLGFCLKGDERLLVYEFVPNASLDHFIFDPIKRTNLDWDARTKIIVGIAQGLLYLHEDSPLRIIHRDLKASNILLDENMTAKIADFGLAKLFVIDQTQSNTSRIVGTYGYMAPEYAMHGHFSVKSDVFSFGVLLLEIVSGQKTNSFRHDEHLDYLSNAWKNWRAGTASNLVDPLMRIGSMSEVIRSLHIGLLCVQENVAERPTMNSIALMLNSHSGTLPVPSRPAFYVRTDAISYDVSVNEASITTLYPR